MTRSVGGLSGGGSADRSARAVITSAQSATSEEQASRQRRYAITMAFRTACFVCMIFVPGTLRWVLFGCAVFLPYVAVVFANQADTKTRSGRVEPGEPQPAAELPVGRGAAQVIRGFVVEETPSETAERDRSRRSA